VTTGEVTQRHIEGTKMILIAYPYVVAGGYTVLGKDPRTGLYDAHFGLITQSNPHVCEDGYQSTDDRSPHDRGNRPMNMKAHCAEPQDKSSARGAQHSPKYRGMANRAPVVAAYDAETGDVEWTDRSPDASISYTGGAAATFGQESWKWLLLQPLAGDQ
jgi:phospholipid/cholesterol/gamma-HCH transport system substrate-binding protein